MGKNRDRESLIRLLANTTVHEIIFRNTNRPESTEFLAWCSGTSSYWKRHLSLQLGAQTFLLDAVKSFVASNADKIAIYNLPPYSPELNPDEHVWAYLKAHQLKNHQAQTKEELKKLIKNKMHGIQKKNRLVNSFLCKVF